MQQVELWMEAGLPAHGCPTTTWAALHKAVQTVLRAGKAGVRGAARPRRWALQGEAVRGISVQPGTQRRRRRLPAWRRRGGAKPLDGRASKGVLGALRSTHRWKSRCAVSWSSLIVTSTSASWSACTACTACGEGMTRGITARCAAGPSGPRRRPPNGRTRRRRGRRAGMGCAGARVGAGRRTGSARAPRAAARGGRAPVLRSQRMAGPQGACLYQHKGQLERGLHCQAEVLRTAGQGDGPVNRAGTAGAHARWE